MAEPPWPPPDDDRPFDWRRDAPEWGEDEDRAERVGLAFVILAMAALGAGFWLLWTLR